jgi:hypothetical protein
MKWQELLPKRMPYGKYDYQIWMTDKKYTVERYMPSIDDYVGDHDGTVFSGSFYKTETRRDQLMQIIEDIKGLAEEIEEMLEDEIVP